MKIRVKFSKEGCMKFIGHLDMMRYFQKAIRRADIPIAFSEGFSPHMILSFASPLGVGLTSSGEYFDMELTEEMPTAEIAKRLNAAMVDGVSIISAKKVDDGKASKAMSLVAAADYLVTFHDGCSWCSDWEEKIAEYYNLPAITVLKKTKKSEREMDIKPYIYELRLENHNIFMKLSAGSSVNIKPELVMEGFAAYLGIDPEEYSFQVHRLEVYADVSESNQPRELKSLEALGEDIE